MTAISVLLTTAPPPAQAAEANGPFVKVDGRECILRSAELFLNREPIKQLQLAVAPDKADEAKQKYGAHLGFSGVKLVVGGPRWIDQLSAGAKTLAADSTHVLIHDAARPAVPFSDIDAIIEAANKYEAVALAAPVAGGLVEVDEGGGPLAFRAAGEFMAWLSPQIVSRKVFEAWATSGQMPHASKWMLVRGSPLNMRVNGAGDAGLAKTMLNMLPKPKLKAPTTPFEEAQW